MEFEGERTCLRSHREVYSEGKRTCSCANSGCNGMGSSNTNVEISDESLIRGLRFGEGLKSCFKRLVVARVVESQVVE